MKKFRIMISNKDGDAVMCDTNSQEKITDSFNRFQQLNNAQTFQVFQLEDGIYCNIIKEHKQTIGFH